MHIDFGLLLVPSAVAMAAALLRQQHPNLPPGVPCSMRIIDHIHSWRQKGAFLSLPDYSPSLAQFCSAGCFIFPLNFLAL